MDADYLAHQLDVVYAGKAWYGKNILNSLSELNFDKVLQRIGGGHNIAELVLHMSAWRRYTLFVLQNDAHYEMEENENFPAVTDISKKEWQQLLEDFADIQTKLKEQFHVAGLLTKKIPQKSYTLLDLLQGIIHHDIYHLGQINMLAKL